MARVEVWKASAIGTYHACDLEIVATHELPDMDYKAQDWESKARDRFASQAKLIVDALLASLPGGTVDAVLVELLDRHRSLLKVSRTLKASES